MNDIMPFNMNDRNREVRGVVKNDKGSTYQKGLNSSFNMYVIHCIACVYYCANNPQYIMIPTFNYCVCILN